MFLKTILEKYRVQADDERLKGKIDKMRGDEESLPPMQAASLRQAARSAGSAAADGIVNKGLSPAERRAAIDKAYRKFLKDNNVKGYAPSLFQLFIAEIQNAEDPGDENEDLN